MISAVRKLKINKRFASSACATCGDALALGEDGAVCEACESPHHARCWDEGGGCGERTCVNAPLPDLGVAGEKRQLRSDEKWCPYCDKIVYEEAEICRHCGQIITADGLYHGEKTIAPEAKLALMYSIFGLFCCFGLILGPLAFKTGMDAKKSIAANPRLRGRAMAGAAQVIGIVDLVFLLATLAFNPSLGNDLAYWSGFFAVPAIGFVLLLLLVRRKLNRS